MFQRRKKFQKRFQFELKHKKLEFKFISLNLNELIEKPHLLFNYIEII